MSLCCYLQSGDNYINSLLAGEDPKCSALQLSLERLWDLRLDVSEVPALFRAVAAHVGMLNRKFDGEKWKVSLSEEKPGHYVIRIFPASEKSNSRNFIKIIHIQKMLVQLRAWEFKKILESGMPEEQKGGEL